jgi:lysozyme family protein
MIKFNDYLKVILKHEGGYINHPSDPGGETKYGISKRAYPTINIKELTIEDASAIYYNDYWLKLKIDNIKNEGLKLHIFDMAVNAGIKTAIKLLQSIVGTTQDGVLGPRSEAKIALYQGDIVESYKKARIDYYNKLIKNKPQLQVFIKGWINRVNSTNFINE